MRTLIIAVYSHPESYPPTLNAIACLSKDFDRIVVVCRNVMPTEWKYPSNTTVIASGEYIPVQASEKKGTGWKIKSFLQFRRSLSRAILAYKPAVIQFCDPMVILAYRFNKRGKHLKLWYHNHDVIEKTAIGKYSLGALSLRAETAIFSDLAIFSLPAIERKQYFPMDRFRGKFFLIPNFPSKTFYASFYKPVEYLQDDSLRLIYQGSIGTGHGLEDIIPLLNQKIEGHQLQLVLKGFIRPAYQEELTALAARHQVTGQLSFYPVTSYEQVPKLASECHIGIAIHRGGDVMNKTLGTASNKIYEYAAVGLPVLLYNNEHFKAHLSKFEWTFFTDCTAASLTSCLHKIVLNYKTLSATAHKDFMASLNFENYFTPVSQYLHQNT